MSIYKQGLYGKKVDCHCYTLQNNNDQDTSLLHNHNMGHTRMRVKLYING